MRGTDLGRLHDQQFSSTPAAGGGNIWIRADGQSARNNPALAQQFAADKAGCTVNAEVNRICMSQHGYVLVPANQAEAAAAQLRAKAGTAPAPAPAPGT